MGKKKILFLCTHNSCRSQIAEALTNHFLNDKYEAKSAGTIPTFVHPLAKKVLEELNIDISTQSSKHINTFNISEFDIIVTLCDNAKESCVIIPLQSNIKILHQSFNDPSLSKGNEDEVLNSFRNTRDQIKEWLINTFK